MTRDRGGATDAILAALLFAAAVAYLGSFPRSLSAADESYFLYESARVRNGEVMYRDIFQFITPLASYLMALLFWIFGASIDTAHVAMAVLHGLTAAALYATCRSLAVRWELAAIAAVAYVAVCRPAWPYASPHWFSTHVVTLIVLSLVGGRWHDRPRWSILPGFLAGVLIGIQQQKGIIVAAAVGTIFAVDHLAGLRLARGEGWRRLALRIAFFSAGVLAVVVPVLGVCVAMAGFDAVYEALVRFPLESYPNTFGVRWGRLDPLAKSFADFTFPTFLRWIPLLFVVLVPRWCWCVLSAARAGEGRALTVLTLCAAFSVLSILYYPDVVHIAFIAPVFLAGIAEAVQWMLTSIVRRQRGLETALAWSLTAAVLVVLVPHMQRHLKICREVFSISRETAFGRIAFANQSEPVVVDRLRSLLADVPGREIYGYPNISSLYLMTGGKNPTPFQWFIAGQAPPEYTQKVLSILRRHSLPYIVGALPFMNDRDPVVRYIKENYEPFEPQDLGLDGLAVVWPWRRKEVMSDG